MVIEKNFLDENHIQFEQTVKLCPGLKFVPVVYLGTRDDNGVGSLLQFNSFRIVKDNESLLDAVNEQLMPSVRIRFWGVRGSTPCANFENIEYGGNTSCMEIDAPGMDELLIFDSGTGIRNLGNHLERLDKMNNRGRIFITHPHWDHIQGFPFFKPFYSSKNKFSIHLPEQYRGGAQEILSGHLTKTFFPVTLDMLDATIEYVTQKEEREDYGHYSIEYFVANHSTKTAIYKIRIGGRVIVYAPDNELPLNTTPIRFVEKFQEFIKDADVLIHDAQYTLQQYKEREGWGHSAWERVIEVVKPTGVKNLYLTHHDPDTNDEVLRRRDSRLKQYEGAPFDKVSLTREGAEIRIPVKRSETIMSGNRAKVS
ncbi:MBL fold metallo-hydrolase [Rhodohalobacter barkolensis]|uniref:MBL fold metallo-hydrolase n=1 Tax=Rhodohalobacter barkolensis TaxID=2053187 RepID=UPI001F0C52D5|nr:MBL fold metallo-hydrolase [Rhodohalobacter barkolensis]